MMTMDDENVAAVAAQAAEDQSLAEFRDLVRQLGDRLAICADMANRLALRATKPDSAAVLAINDTIRDEIYLSVFRSFWGRSLDVCWPAGDDDDGGPSFDEWIKDVLDD